MQRVVHEGRNIKRIREILGVKQEALAADLGIHQQKISLIEQKEVIEPEILNSIAHALNVPPDAIKNYNEDATINIIANTMNENSGLVNYNASAINYNYPAEKIMVLIEENKQLYERLLAVEREKQLLYEKLIEKLEAK